MFRVLGAILEANGGPLSDEDFAEAMRALEPDWNGWLGDDGAPPRVPVVGAWWGSRNFDPSSRQFRGASILFPLNHDLKPYGPHCDSCLRGIVGAALAARWGKAGDRG